MGCGSTYENAPGRPGHQDRHGPGQGQPSDDARKLQRGDREDGTRVGEHPCLELDEHDPPKQEICCSRMFGKRLQDLARIKEAVATYMMRASEKLRAQNSLCKKIRVSLRTGMFNPEEAKYANGVLVDLPYPTDDVHLLTKAAVDALDRVFRPGFNYSKAEVLLLNLCQLGEYTDDLFATSQPAEATKVMTVLDQINKRWGSGTLRSASVPTNPDWAMRREMMSQSYTTRLDQLWKVFCVYGCTAAFTSADVVDFTERDGSW